MLGDSNKLLRIGCNKIRDTRDRDHIHEHNYDHVLSKT
jgi:hypothetical protein